MTQDQAEVRGKTPQSSNFPKYICTQCGTGYYSAAPLSKLHDPYCEECRGELDYADDWARRRDENA